MATQGTQATRSTWIANEWKLETVNASLLVLSASILIVVIVMCQF